VSGLDPVPRPAAVQKGFTMSHIEHANGTPNLLDESHAAACLGRARDTLYRLADHGAITPRSVRHRGRWSKRYDPNQIDEAKRCLDTADALRANGYVDATGGKLWALEYAPGPKKTLRIADLCTGGDVSRRYLLGEAATDFGISLQRLTHAIENGHLTGTRVYGHGPGGVHVVSKTAVEDFFTTTKPQDDAAADWAIVSKLQTLVDAKTVYDKREVAEQASFWAKNGLLPTDKFWTEQAGNVVTRRGKKATKALHQRTAYHVPTFRELWNKPLADDVDFVRRTLAAGQMPAKELRKKLADERFIIGYRAYRVLHAAGAVFKNKHRQHLYGSGRGQTPKRKYKKGAIGWLKEQLEKAPMLTVMAIRKGIKKGFSDSAIRGAAHDLRVTEHFSRWSPWADGKLVGGHVPRFWLLPGQTPPTEDEAKRAFEKYLAAKKMPEPQANGTAEPNVITECGGMATRDANEAMIRELQTGNRIHQGMAANIEIIARNSAAFLHDDDEPSGLTPQQSRMYRCMKNRDSYDLSRFIEYVWGQDNADDDTIRQALHRFNSLPNTQFKLERSSKFDKISKI
jgi:hypothetical protein